MEQNGYISINTNDLQPSSSHANATYLPFNLQTRNIRQWAVDKYSFRSQTPNINPYNNTIVINDGANSYPVVIPEGFYTTTTIVPVIQAQLNLSPITNFVVTQNPDGSVTVQNAVTPFNIINTGVQGVKSLGAIMGWKVGDLNEPLLNEFTGYADLVYSHYADIVSIDLNNYNSKDDYFTNTVVSNVLTRIFYNYSEPVTVVGENTNMKIIDTSKWFDSQTIRIEVRDEYGNIWYDPENKLEYSLLMLTS